MSIVKLVKVEIGGVKLKVTRAFYKSTVGLVEAVIVPVMLTVFVYVTKLKFCVTVFGFEQSIVTTAVES